MSGLSSAWPLALLATLVVALCAALRNERTNLAVLRSELAELRAAASQDALQRRRLSQHAELAELQAAAPHSNAQQRRRLSQQADTGAERGRHSRHRQEVAELLTHVEPAFREPCRQILSGEPTSFAQAWQDWWLFHNLFKHRNHGAALRWGTGFYVELGVWNPMFATNTLFFDKCLGWRGVCVEPNQQWWPSIRANRSCTLLPNCVAADNSTKYELVRGGPSGGIAHIRASDKSNAKSCVVLGDALKRLGLGEQQIDLLSIDVEGRESDVLRCFDFEKHKPAAVTLARQSPLASTRARHRNCLAKSPCDAALTIS